MEFLFFLDLSSNNLTGNRLAAKELGHVDNLCELDLFDIKLQVCQNLYVFAGTLPLSWADLKGHILLLCSNQITGG